VARTLILTGGRGLAKELAAESLARGFQTTIVGNRAAELRKEPALKGAMFRSADLADPYALPTVMCGCWAEMTHVLWEVPGFGPKPPLELTIEDARYMLDMGLVGGVGALTALHRLKTASRPLAESPGSPMRLAVLVPSCGWQSEDGMAMQSAVAAAAAHFARGYAATLAASLPGSGVELIHKVPVRDADGHSPADAAKYVWNAFLSHDGPFRESHLMNDPRHGLHFEHFPRPPELAHR
jgi:NAD(P)-dependent dehydrogenase (short-subunit alcohol dehydrogenase family)